MNRNVESAPSSFRILWGTWAFGMEENADPRRGLPFGRMPQAGIADLVEVLGQGML